MLSYKNYSQSSTYVSQCWEDWMQNYEYYTLKVLLMFLKIKKILLQRFAIINFCSFSLFLAHSNIETFLFWYGADTPFMIWSCMCVTTCKLQPWARAQGCSLQVVTHSSFPIHHFVHISSITWELWPCTVKPRLFELQLPKHSTIRMLRLIYAYNQP